MADEHFAPQIILLSGTLCIPTHFASQHSLLPDTLYSSAHFASRNTLLPGTLYSLEHFTPWNTLLPGTLCLTCSRERRVPRSRVVQEAKSAEKQNVLKSKVF